MEWCFKRRYGYNVEKRETSFHSPNVNLPLPLDKCGLEAFKYADEFCLKFWVEAQDSNRFNKLSRRLNGAINNPGELWLPTRMNGIGYVVKAKEPRRPIVSVGVYDERQNARQIVIGGDGAETRILDRGRFEEAVLDLSIRAESFLNAIYSRTKVFDIDLTLSP